MRDFRKYIKGRKMSDDHFLALAEQSISDEALAGEQEVRAYTPDPEEFPEMVLDGTRDKYDSEMPGSSTSVSTSATTTAW